VSCTRLLERRRLGRPHHVLHAANWIACRRVLQREAALDVARDRSFCSSAALLHLQVYLPGRLERRSKWPCARKKTPPAFSVLQLRRPGREWPVVRGWGTGGGASMHRPCGGGFGDGWGASMHHPCGGEFGGEFRGGAWVRRRGGGLSPGRSHGPPPHGRYGH
jgi:hypothetical protein